MAATSSNQTHQQESAKAKISGAEWKYAAKRTLAEFTRDGGTDLAAQLTYFTVLAIAPALLAIFSLSALLLSGFQDQIADLIKKAIENSGVAGGEMELGGAIDSTLQSLMGSSTGGTIALIIGIATALWSASAYVKAFSRASNHVYGVEETRGPVKFNLSMLAVTTGLLVGILAILVSLLLSQSIVDGVLGPIFSAAGMGGTLSFLTNTFLPIWAWAKWPVVLILLFAVVSLLYWATPNLKRPYAFITAGSVLAVIGLGVAIAALSIYMATLAGYSSYGAIGGLMAIVFVLWVVNIVIVFGAEFDAEVVRARQLAAGEPAEETFELPKRGEETPTKKDKKYATVVDEGRDIRLSNLHHNDGDSSTSFAGADASRDRPQSGAARTSDSEDRD